MADVNQQAQELAEVLQRVQDEMRQFGRVTDETQAALKAGSYRRARELDQASKLTGDALGELAGAGLAAAKSMYAGEKGAAAFNSSLDGMAKAATAAGAALTFLMPGGFLIKALVGLGTAAVSASLAMTKSANEMADKLFAANTKMAKSGAAASDGMMGMFRDAKKLGLSMKELGVYTDLVAANSAELALFKGTAFEGRKAFANIGASMKPFRASLEAAGISLEDQTAGLAGYLRLQTQIGQSQNMSTQQLASGARNYLIQMDGLSKLTGMQREEMEKQMEAARNEQRFRAKLDAMRASGDAKQIAAADRLERANILISKQAPELAQGFRDIASGAITSDAATKGLIGTQGQLLQSTEALTTGQIDEFQAFQQIGRSAGQFAKDMNFTAQLGLLNDFSVDYAQAMKIGIATTKDVTELNGIIQAEQNKQLGAQNDANTKALADLRERQRNLNEMAETTIAGQIRTSLQMGHALAGVTDPLLQAFQKLAPAVEKLTQLMIKALEWLAPKLNKLVGGVADVIMAEGMDAKVKAAGKAGLTETAGGIGMGVAGAKLGATGGAIIGSVVPVIGTAIGAALGGLLGGATGFFAGRGLGRAADASAQDKGFMDQLKALVDEKIFSSERRAAGGPVRNRTPYLVGERGPELMVPEQSGNIVNNDRLRNLMQSMGKDAANFGHGMMQTLGKDLSTSKSLIQGTSKELASGFDIMQGMNKDLSTSKSLIQGTSKELASGFDIMQGMNKDLGSMTGEMNKIKDFTGTSLQSVREMDVSYSTIKKIIGEFENTQGNTLRSINAVTEGSGNAATAISKTYGSIVKVIDNLNDKNKDTTVALIATQKDTLTQAESIEKFTEQNARRSKKFSDVFKNYVEKMTAALDEDLGMITGGAAGSAAAGGTAGGGGAAGGGSGGGAAGGGSGGFIGRLMASMGAMAGGASQSGQPGEQTNVNYDAEGRSTGGGGAKPEPAAAPQGGPGQQGRPRKTTDGAIYHHTGGRSLSAAVNTLKARGLAYHYMIDRDGSIVPFMPDNAVAYHAGPTDKNPKFGNWNTLGIAAVANNNDDLTKEQLAAAVKLNQQLSSKFGFGSQNIFGHGQVTSRKMADEGAGMVKAIQTGLSALNTTTGSAGPPQAEKGGVLTGPTEGYAAMLHGTEAVVPLPDGKKIPVQIDLNDPAMVGPTVGGYNQYTGYNMGPMSTDLNTVKQLAGYLGAFDKATQTITDPKTWKEIINSGVAMNYELGVAKIGSTMLPNIGQEMAQRVSEIIADKGVDQTEALKTMTQEFKTALTDAIGKLTDQQGTAEVRDLLSTMVNKQSEANDLSKKILQTAY